MYRLVVDTLPPDGLRQYSRDSARIMTAMTFDIGGEPVDYFKQVFTAFDIANNLASEGREVDVQLIIADNAVVLNRNVEYDDTTIQQLQHHARVRREVLAALAEIYASDLKVNVRFTSELVDDAYEEIVKRLGDRVEDDDTLRKLLLRSVPDHQYNPSASARVNTEYTRRELAVILRSGADIKVGPRRERFYDAAARDSSVLEAASDSTGRVIGTYVTNTYPTNVSDEQMAYLRKNGGILPYKAGGPDITPKENRILIHDSEATIQSKLRSSPSELRNDIESLIAYMNDWGPRYSGSSSAVLSAHLHLIQEQLETNSDVKERLAIDV